MFSLYSKPDEYISNEKNFIRIIFFLVVFLCAVKLPMLITTDIQPWDEGMYATRVLSIYVNGDFFDQSQHSVGKFYSGSHPPLLIWLGYVSTLLFGISSTSLKIIPFIFSLLSVILIMLISKRFFNTRVAFFAALIFCSNIIFNVFSKRFQFDYPFTFFFLLSFYLIVLYNDTLKLKYLILCGISFGLCLMVKILVGFYIPFTIFMSLLVMKDRIRIRLKDILILTVIGILIALPWHVYMLNKYGSEFTNFFLKFHIFDRALQGVEFNVKRSGPLYHMNYLMTIIPYSVIVFIALIKDFRNFSRLSAGKIFLWLWFLSGMIILAMFKTKLEVYILIPLTPGCILMSAFADEIDKESLITKTVTLILIVFNFIWFATESVRPEIKEYLTGPHAILIFILMLLFIAILYFIFRAAVKKYEIRNLVYSFIFIFFISLNLYYLYNVPFWENNFHITDVKNHIEESGRKKLVYVATNYRHNPQFSFYFKGLDIGWRNDDYEFVFLDNKNGTDSVKSVLSGLPKNEYEIIVEKEGINRAVYKDSELFIPEDFKMKVSSPGYELYEN